MYEEIGWVPETPRARLESHGVTGTESFWCPTKALYSWNTQILNLLYFFYFPLTRRATVQCILCDTTQTQTCKIAKCKMATNFANPNSTKQYLYFSVSEQMDKQTVDRRKEGQTDWPKHVSIGAGYKKIKGDKFSRQHQKYIFTLKFNSGFMS